MLQQFYPQEILFALENIICAYQCKNFNLKSVNVLPSIKTPVIRDTIFYLAELILYATSLLDRDSKQNLDKNHLKLCISCIIIWLTHYLYLVNTLTNSKFVFQR